MLEINNITKKYTKGEQIFTALDQVAFSVSQGEFIAVVGPSGSGKSTLLHAIGGLNQPDSGDILFRGENIYLFGRKEADQYRSEKVGFVFQQFHLMPYLTVLDNISLVCRQKDHHQKALHFLETCALMPLRDKFPSELSVGERQRVAFIRAILGEPDLLLADEPTGNLDPGNSLMVMEMMADFHKKGGTVLLVSHNPEIARYAGRYIRLEAGKLK